MSEHDALPAPPGFSIDPRRRAVAEETLRRPPLPVPAPGRCAHLAFMTTLDQANGQRDHVRQLLNGWGATVELDRFDQIIAATPVVTLKWERHTEFCSITLISAGDSSEEWPPLDAEWAADCPGDLLVALKINVLDPEQAPALPAGEQFADRQGRSLVNGGTAEVSVAYTVQSDGYLEMSVTTREPQAHRVGRLVQRLIEIETYRELALCAWPDVQALGPALNTIDAGLAELTDQLAVAGQRGEDGERALLVRLTDLARELEHTSARTHFRLNASLAYADLVQRRLEELREERIEGNQRISSLINRRLRPAARTYRSILTRQREMSERISRTSDLLRSRIDVELAHQNQQLLASMNRRSDMQLRLQQTVEGLSVVAISYYAISILAKLFEALAISLPWLNSKIATGVSAPIVILLVFLAVRRIRRSIADH